MRNIRIPALVLTILLSGMGMMAQRPNVIVVLADDIGVGDISHYRRMHSTNIKLETPNIDSIARSGMVFTHAHSPAALCAPSRYAFMTGNHCYRSSSQWGVWGSYEASAIRDTDLTLGRLMKRAGYHTSFFGKWHLGGDFYRKSQPGTIYRSPRQEPELDVDITRMVDGPPQKGFDYSFTFPAGIQDVPYAVIEDGEWMPLAEDSEIIHITQDRMDSLGVTLDKDEGLGDSRWDPHNMGPLLAGKAVDYIHRQAGGEEPFFMYYCSQAVHLPHTPPDSLDGVAVAGTTPVKHMDMIRELDVQMGMLVSALKEEGVYDNTLFIFTSDNGGLSFSSTLATGHNPSSIYRGGKNSRYEGGHRVPFIVSWPDAIAPGLTSAEPVSGTDILATLASVTGTDLYNGEALDSHNQLPLLLGEEGATGRPFLMLQGGTGQELIYIEDGWKLIMQSDPTGTQRDPIALFNLDSNPSENEGMNYVNSPALKDRVATMQATYNRIRDSRITTRNYTAITVGYDHPHLYSQGRMGLNPPLETKEFYWPGSSLSIDFLGDQASVILEDQKGENYFNVIVDGEITQVLKLEEGLHEYLLASGLDHDLHRVELHKRNDWSYGYTRFHGFELNAITSYPREEKDLFIEFYGNSITTGYGNEDYTGEDRSTGDVTNNYLAYGAVTARNLDADYTCISHSGIGIMVSWHEIIMSEEYYRHYPGDSQSVWDFSAKQADYVVINLFQNDSWLIEQPDHPQFIARFGDTPPTESEIVSAYGAFLDSIRAVYPKANIICMLGNMDITREGSPWPGYVSQAAALAGDRVHTLFVPYKNTPGHPKVEEQQIIADRLTELILDISDTIHNFSLELHNAHSGEAIQDARVLVDEQEYQSDHDGRVNLTLVEGNYNICIEAERFADTCFTAQVDNDSVLQVGIRQVLANVKFVVKKDGVALHNAEIELAGSKQWTSTVGITNFYDLSTDSLLIYEVSYNTQVLGGDSLILKTDTTLRLNYGIVGLTDARSSATSIYPNPASDHIYLSPASDRPVPYSIIDMRGRQVGSGQIQDYIDVSPLQAGIYVLLIDRCKAFMFSIE